MSTLERTQKSYYDPQYRGLSIILRDNKSGPTWHLRWNRPQQQGVGQYIYLGRFGSEERALRARRRAQDMIDDGIAPTPAHFNGGLNVVAKLPDKTFGQEGRKWIDAQSVAWKGGKDGSTYKVRAGYLKRVIELIGEDTNPEDIDLTRARKLYADLLEVGMKPSSISGLTQAIAQILDFAEVESNPFRDRRLARPKGRSPKRPLPLIKNFNAARAELTGIDAMIWDIMEHGGLRPSEACHLRWEDVTPLALFLPGEITKNGDPRTVELLDFQREDGIDWLPKRPEGASDRAFIVGSSPRDTDKPILTASKLNGRFAKACKEAGVPSINPYALRHLHVSRLHEWMGKRHDLSPKAQADRLGHELDQAEASYIQRLPSS